MTTETYLYVLGWIIQALGSLAVVGLSVFGVMWAWGAVVVNFKQFRVVLYLTRLRFKGRNEIANMFWKALDEYIDGEVVAYNAVKLIKRKYPNCEHVWDDALPSDEAAQRRESP